MMNFKIVRFGLNYPEVPKLSIGVLGIASAPILTSDSLGDFGKILSVSKIPFG